MKLALYLPNSPLYKQLLAEQKVFAWLEQPDILGHPTILIEFSVNDSTIYNQAYEVLYQILKLLIDDFLHAIKNKNVVAFADASTELNAFCLFARECHEALKLTFTIENLKAIERLGDIKKINQLLSVFPEKLSEEDLQSFDNLYAKISTQYFKEIELQGLGKPNQCVTFESCEPVARMFSECLVGRPMVENTERLFGEDLEKIVSEQTTAKDRLPHLELQRLAVEQLISDLLSTNDLDILLSILVDINEYQVQKSVIKLTDDKIARLLVLRETLKYAVDNLRQKAKSMLARDYITEISSALSSVEKICSEQLENVMVKGRLEEVKKQKAYEANKQHMVTAIQDKVGCLESLNTEVISYKNAYQVGSLQKDIASSLVKLLDSSNFSVKKRVMLMDERIKACRECLESTEKSKYSLVRVCQSISNAFKAVCPFYDRHARKAHWKKAFDSSKSAKGLKFVGCLFCHKEALAMERAPSPKPGEAG